MAIALVWIAAQISSVATFVSSCHAIMLVILRTLDSIFLVKLRYLSWKISLSRMNLDQVSTAFVETTKNTCFFDTPLKISHVPVQSGISLFKFSPACQKP
jgi:hypothetical protein